MSDYKIALVGESWGSEESIAHRPFIGAAGQELNRMLRDAGLRREDIFVTNVFNIHPPQNDIEYFLCSKKDLTASKRFVHPLLPSKYLKVEFECELDRLYKELETIRPNLVVALGNTAAWALTHDSKISKLRGTVSYCAAPLEWLKCLYCYHPAAVLRQWEFRHVSVLDLVKAKNEAEFPEVRRIEREIWLDPVLRDIEEFYEKYVLATDKMAADIETNYGEQITCIGFAPSKNRAICIPIFDYRKPSGSYWDTLEEELEAWNLIQKILDSPCKKIFQNGMFDLQHLWQTYGITARNAGEDTMLLHHSLHPEAPKALDFLGSVYSSEVAWKNYRSKANKTIKREG